MRSTSKRGIAIVLSALMVLSVAGGAMALTVDTETTNSAGQSDLTDTSTITEPHNSSQTYRVQIKGDSNTNTSSLTNPETEMIMRVVVNDSGHPQDGEVLYENASNFSVTTVASAPDHYYTNVTNSDWGDELEYNATENVSVDYRVVFNESETDESVMNITPTVDPAAQPDARIEVADSERQLAGFESSNDSFLASLLGSSSVGAAEANQSIGVTSKTDNITIDLDNQSSADALSESVGDQSSGDLVLTTYARVNDQLVPVFVGSAGDQKWLDEGTEAYATIDTSSDEIVIHNANDTFGDSTTSIDVSVTANEKMGSNNARKMLSAYGAGPLETAMTAFSARDWNGDPFDDRDVPIAG